MGWQDRDYARPHDASRGGGPASVFGGRQSRYAPRSVVKLLIFINVGVFILCALTAGPRHDVRESALFAWGAMHRAWVMDGQIWRLVTSDYLHWGVTHLLWNMLGLWFLGRPLEQVWGARKFFAVYTIAGILGSLFYMLLTFYWFADGIAAGASGCVLGLLGACAILFPNAEVWIYFLFPVKIRTLAIVLGAWYALNIWSSGHNAGGDACHLAGLVFGIWWATHGDCWWSRRGVRVQRVAARPRRAAGFKERIAQRRADVKTVDRILAKINTTGIASLTPAEKRALAEATERQNEEERRLGRVDRV